jgi:uncharacterized protein (TIGR00661 family)
MTYRDGAVARARTVLAVGRSARAAVRETVALYRRAIAGFQPEVCISDFDSFSHVFGKLFDRPVISLDHQHVIDRCEHAPAVTHRLPRDFRLTRALVRAKVPGCAHYLVTSFYFPPPKRARTTLVGPILRPEVAALAPERGDHILVYQTAHAAAELVAMLRAVPEQRFVVYARGGAVVGTEGNVTVRAFDEGTFLEDLAAARAVITNGGYTLLSEALYLGKRVLSVPLRHQGEQELNAAYLADLRLGTAVRQLDVATVRRFARGDDAAPARRVAAGNAQAFATIDRLLEEVT